MIKMYAHSSRSYYPFYFDILLWLLLFHIIVVSCGIAERQPTVYRHTAASRIQIWTKKIVLSRSLRDNQTRSHVCNCHETYSNVVAGWYRSTQSVGQLIYPVYADAFIFSFSASRHVCVMCVYLNVHNILITCAARPLYGRWTMKSIWAWISCV